MWRGRNGTGRRGDRGEGHEGTNGAGGVGDNLCACDDRTSDRCLSAMRRNRRKSASNTGLVRTCEAPRAQYSSMSVSAALAVTPMTS